ncbi:Gamma-glutamylcyclotransferase family protein [Balamuthia mandrillaris]
MSLLLTSERVYADLVDWLWHGEPEQVVLRRWEPELVLDLEFRAFVYEGLLTAISQYDHYCVYPRLFTMKEEIQRAILELWEQVHPCIGESSYVIDFGYLPQSKRCVVIELSPFLPCTGPALFSWSRDADLLHGRCEQMEFRLKIEPLLESQLEDLVEMNWEVRWKEHAKLPKYWHFYPPLAPSSSSSSSASSFSSSSSRGLLSYLSRPFLHKGRAVAEAVTSKHRGTQKPCQEKDTESKMENDYERGAEGFLLFFYGTLKRGFHWNQKYLSHGATFLGDAQTVEAYPMVLGECGVPYLLGGLKPGEGLPIRGELWRVTSDTLQSLDDYEGVHKGYYTRREVRVRCCQADSAENEKEKEETEIEMKAQAYFKAAFDDVLREAKFLQEYTLELHRQHYKPIRHILVKQLKYLGCDEQRT